MVRVESQKRRGWEGVRSWAQGHPLTKGTFLSTVQEHPVPTPAPHSQVCIPGISGDAREEIPCQENQFWVPVQKGGRIWGVLWPQHGPAPSHPTG